MSDRDDPRAEDQAADELARSLQSLSELAVTPLALRDTLIKVAQFAVLAIPGAEGAGLTLIGRNGAETLVATHDFVTDVDSHQYRLREGPCITAAREGRTVLSRSLGEDPRWPIFGSKVAHLGVHSALSLPLITPGRVVGAMNIYARSKAAFYGTATRLGEVFAAPAAETVQNAELLASARTLLSRVQSGLTDRAVVDQAVGLLVGRHGINAEQARERLRWLASSRGQHLTEAAASLLAEATPRSEPQWRPRRDDR